MKKVIDVYGRKVIVADEQKQMVSYRNEEKMIRFNAEIVEEGRRTGFFTDYAETGVVSNLEQMVSQSMKIFYPAAVGYAASDNDPDGEIYGRMAAYIRENQDIFFKKNGDLKHVSQKNAQLLREHAKGE